MVAEWFLPHTTHYTFFNVGGISDDFHEIDLDMRTNGQVEIRMLECFCVRLSPQSPIRTYKCPDRIGSLDIWTHSNDRAAICRNRGGSPGSVG